METQLNLKSSQPKKKFKTLASAAVRLSVEPLPPSVRQAPEPRSPNFKDAYLGIPSSVRSYRLLLRMAYPRVILINYCHSSMISVVVIFMARMKYWLAIKCFDVFGSLVSKLVEREPHGGRSINWRQGSNFQLSEAIFAFDRK
ncbi:uncharacterized protein DS421_20g679070 [Arachis hypogaea]|nr:uncharacterized protein DS421_20g679070 [Arachis hypogaea]